MKSCRIAGGEVAQWNCGDMGDYAALAARSSPRHLGNVAWVKGLSFEIKPAVGNNLNDFSQVAQRKRRL